MSWRPTRTAVFIAAYVVAFAAVYAAGRSIAMRQDTTVGHLAKRQTDYCTSGVRGSVNHPPFWGRVDRDADLRVFLKCPDPGDRASAEHYWKFDTRAELMTAVAASTKLRPYDLCIAGTEVFMDQRHNSVCDDVGGRYYPSQIDP